MTKSKYEVIISIILAGAFTRLLPHPPNFTPIGAIALFGGANLYPKLLAFLIPLLALFVSDLALQLLFGYGFHSQMMVVYGSFVLVTCLGFWLRKNKKPHRIVLAVLSSSILFFLTTNFGVWLLDSLYPTSFEGFVACYVAAIPFFRNMLLGDMIYSLSMFGLWALIEKRFFATGVRFQKAA